MEKPGAEVILKNGRFNLPASMLFGVCSEKTLPDGRRFFRKPNSRDRLEQIRAGLQMIRQANFEDAEILAGLIRHSFKDVAERFGLTPENTPKHPSNCQTDWIEQAFDKGILFFLMENDGQAVGCVGIENVGDGLFYLERLAVRPEFRGQGNGALLVEHALTEARRMGAKTVQIGIIAEQTDLENWYKARGFKTTGRKKFDHLPFTVAFMVRTL